MKQFKNPQDASDSDAIDELAEEGEAYEAFGDVIILPDDDVDSSDVEIEENQQDLFEPEVEESDSTSLTDSSDNDDESMRLAPARNRKVDNEQSGGGSGNEASTSANARAANGGEVCVDSALDENEEDDSTVRAIIAAIKKPRTAPPEIKLDDFVTDICFHPERDIIAVATINGDVCLYEYTNAANSLLRTIEVHAKSCRDVEFSENGRDLLTCSKDKSIMITDMETEKLKKFYESAHDVPINKLYIIDENLFTTGDDNGTVKLWDLRTRNEVFALKECDDFISQMLTNDDKKLLLVTSGDGYLTTLNLGARKVYVQSEPYEEELGCMGIFRGDSKVVAGTSKGNLYTYNWGQFGYHCDMFPGLKTPISEMIPVTDRIACVAGEEGIIRACHIAPFRNLGIVGQHSMPVEHLDINSTGELIASSSHNNDVRFWNVKYFEELADLKYNEKHNAYKESRHNLPSSKFSNASDFFADLAKEDDSDVA